MFFSIFPRKNVSLFELLIKLIFSEKILLKNQLFQQLSVGERYFKPKSNWFEKIRGSYGWICWLFSSSYSQIAIFRSSPQLFEGVWTCSKLWLRMFEVNNKYCSIPSNMLPICSFSPISSCHLSIFYSFSTLGGNFFKYSFRPNIFGRFSWYKIYLQNKYYLKSITFPSYSQTSGIFHSSCSNILNVFKEFFHIFKCLSSSSSSISVSCYRSHYRHHLFFFFTFFIGCLSSQRSYFSTPLEKPYNWTRVRRSQVARSWVESVFCAPTLNKRIRSVRFQLLFGVSRTSTSNRSSTWVSLESVIGIRSAFDPRM